MNSNSSNSKFQNLQGINFGNILDAPNEGDWGKILQEQFFDLVKNAGFNLVRIPIRWSNHADINSPYTINPSFFERIDWVIQNSLSRGLITIINIHHYSEIMISPQTHKKRFFSLWEQISARYQNYPDNLFFEILNEPFNEFDKNPYLWNHFINDINLVIRRINPKRKLIYGPVFHNNLRHLNMLEVPKNDPNIIITFHFYDPFEFSHQGANWVQNSDQWIGTIWQATTQEKLAINIALDHAVDWAKKNNIQLFLGEFGAISKADYNSRVRWTKNIRVEAEKRDIGWAYWNFCEDLFGIYNSKTKLWDRNLLKALLPNSPLI
ncbi:MAG: glycoside hydrolase family 5 protein [Candidatus Lokiarchaeota archaeon]|nr:glycoside hydrolase family 5 protein [Candidatus Lokiarchaeota archaeon]